MSTVAKLTKWVEKKPLILIRFDEDFSESLRNSQQGYEQLTMVKPHATFQAIKLPTLCLLETQEGDETACYMGTVTRKAAVSTFAAYISKRHGSIGLGRTNEAFA